jgi:nucleoside-diphosphate-sugar epimerase
MNNLVIGNTSQLSHYFPNDYIKISSRNIDFDFLRSATWGSVYLCFGESRKYISDKTVYDDINYKLTIDIIDSLYNNCEKIVVYSTCELWNKYSGQISLDNQFDFYETPYLISKLKLTEHILNGKNYNKINIIYPFNFNSIYRDEDFLFGKIFKSLKNGTKINIGDTYFYRDMVHPKFVVNESINSKTHKIVGSGRLTFVNDFIRDLYKNFNLSYEELVNEEKNSFKEYLKTNEYYSKSQNCLYSYDELLRETIKELKILIKK